MLESMLSKLSFLYQEKIVLSNTIPSDLSFCNSVHIQSITIDTNYQTDAEALVIKECQQLKTIIIGENALNSITQFVVDRCPLLQSIIVSKHSLLSIHSVQFTCMLLIHFDEQLLLLVRVLSFVRAW